jgi:hypothetical protein
MTTSASPLPVVTSNNNITSGQVFSSPRRDIKTPEGGLTEKENLLQEVKHELKIKV